MVSGQNVAGYFVAQTQWTHMLIQDITVLRVVGVQHGLKKLD